MRLVVRVAIAGIGNCASSLVQGIQYYRGRTEGMWHQRVGGLSAKDVEVVAAFDIDARKVDVELSDAIAREPNAFKKVVAVPRTGVTVRAGISENETPPHLRGAVLRTSDRKTVARTLEEGRVDLLINVSSSGSARSSRAYAEACLEGGCSYANCTPALILADRRLVSRFRSRRLVVVGDDLMSQFGGTLFHRGILRMLVERGLRPRKSYQLDVGGGAETFNTIDETIRAAKRKVKTASVASEVPYKFQTVTGTTDYVDYMGNERTSYFWLESQGFLGLPVLLDVYLRSSDGANAGNLLLDLARAVKASVKAKRYGAEQEISAYAFKSPPKPVHYDEAYKRFADRYVW